jgi:hypothetical protein
MVVETCLRWLTEGRGLSRVSSVRILRSGPLKVWELEFRSPIHSELLEYVAGRPERLFSARFEDPAAGQEKEVVLHEDSYLVMSLEFTIGDAPLVERASGMAPDAHRHSFSLFGLHVRKRTSGGITALRP